MKRKSKLSHNKSYAVAAFTESLRLNHFVTSHRINVRQNRAPSLTLRAPILPNGRDRSAKF